MEIPEDMKEMTGFQFLNLASKTTSAVEEKALQAAALATAQGTGASASTAVGALNKCQNCVYVLERIKQGYQYLLPSICVEIYSKEGAGAGKEPYGVCHQVLASLSVWGNNVRHWFHYGCYKSEVHIFASCHV